MPSRFYGHDYNRLAATCDSTGMRVLQRKSPWPDALQRNLLATPFRIPKKKRRDQHHRSLDLIVTMMAFPAILRTREKGLSYSIAAASWVTIFSLAQRLNDESGLSLIPKFENS